MISDQNHKERLLSKAREYLKIGWNVISVNQHKKPFEEWTKFQTEFIDEATIKRQLAQYPATGLAVITGVLSGIIVVDVEAGGSTEGLTPTVISKTGGNGWHYYYKHPGVPVKNRVRIREKMDIRGDGGFAVLPPSIHESGKQYDWAVSPFDVPLAEVPDWLLKQVSSNKKPKNLAQIALGVAEGQRNDAAASYIGKLLYTLPQDTWASFGWNSVVAWNQKNTPPLQESELRTVWNSIYSREQTKQTSLDDTEENPNESLKKIFTENKNKGLYKIAKYINKKHSVHTVEGKKSRDVFVYKDGLYVQGENILRQEVQEILEELASSHYKNEIIDKVKDLSLTPRDKFNVDRKFVNLLNGILNVETNELLPHDPSYLFLHKMPVSYDPSIDCPKINKFLSEILNAEDISIIQEWFGFCMYRYYFIKKALILVGERDTGKSTLLNLISAFIGKENISGVSLQKLSADKFAAANMYQKHVNLYDDLAYKDITDNGGFKMATGNTDIPGEFKFRDQFQFKNYAKLTFSCNKIPSVKDTNDDAYFSRWLVVEFNISIPEEKIDKFLLDKITTPEELSGLLNFALIGLNRLLANHCFSYVKDPDLIKTQMLRSGSSVANFAYDCLEEAVAENWITKENMYEEFIKYTQAHKLPGVTKTNFGRQLPKYADYINEGRISDGNERSTTWRNVAFKIVEEDESEDNQSVSAPDQDYLTVAEITEMFSTI